AALTGAIAATSTSAQGNAPGTIRPPAPPLSPTTTPSATPTCLPAWNLVVSPTVRLDLGDAAFNSADAVSANDVWGAGYYIPDTHGLQTPLARAEWRTPHNSRAKKGDQSDQTVERSLIAHWDGSQWTQAPSANASDDDNSLFGLDVLAADDVWAAGYFINSY